MDKNKLYESLNATDKVRINAVIVAGFRDETAFITNFRNALKGLAASKQISRRDAFQQTLEAMRETLACDMANIPTVMLNTVDDKIDLSAQRLLLRDIQGVMGREGHLFEYSAAHYQGIVKKFQPYIDGHPDYAMPQLSEKYGQSDNLIVRTQARLATSNIAGVCVPAVNPQNTTQIATSAPAATTPTNPKRR